MTSDGSTRDGKKWMYLKNITKDLQENVKESKELKMAQLSGFVSCMVVILSTSPPYKSQG